MFWRHLRLWVSCRSRGLRNQIADSISVAVWSGNSSVVMGRVAMVMAEYPVTPYSSTFAVLSGSKLLISEITVPTWT
jgi:hypothetical protein